MEGCEVYDKHVCISICLSEGQIYKSVKAQIFPHYDSAKKLLRKRNSDRYREPQQRFMKPQSTPVTAGTGQCKNAGHV